MIRHPMRYVAGLLSLLACQPSATPPPVDATTEPMAAAQPTPTARPKPELGSFGIDLTARDTTTPAGDDFYGYANGSWLKSYQLKPDEMRYGAFVELEYRAEDQVKAILDEVAKAEPARGTPEQQIADYFASFMDLAALNQKGIEPLRPDLTTIAAIRTRGELVDAFGRSNLMGTATPLAGFVDTDRKDPNVNRLNVIHAGLGMPNRDFYLDAGFAELRKAYSANIQSLLGFTGLSERESAVAAQNVLALETRIAEHSWPPTELRQADKTYNPSTLAELEADVPGYPWRRHFQAQGIDTTELKQVNIATPSALAPIAKLVSQVPLETWRYYLTYHLVVTHASLLGDAIDNATFAFYGKALNGQPEQRDRWKRAIELVGDHQSLGEAIGKLYVQRYFPPDSKAKMDQLVANLRAALGKRLERLDWMGPQTKREAFAKLASFNPKIGYPKKWRDFSSIAIDAHDLVANFKAVRKYWQEDEIARLGRPSDRDEWYMNPQEINAYYNPSFNEIVFPAAILQPPFFDPNADAAVNYGAIGAVIGHEMGHGFDDQGSKADHAGVQRDWWSQADRERFEARTHALVAQYAGYEPLPGQRVNGELTLGENIGDLGGLAMAFEAYQISLAAEAAPVIDGFSGPQRFFLAWAQVWRSKERDEFMLKVLKSDPHSPARFRVNGVVRNLNAWYEAFGVGPDSKLYLAPEQRVSIW